MPRRENKMRTRTNAFGKSGYVEGTPGSKGNRYRRGGRVRGRRFAQGGRTRNTRGQGDHGHPINTGYLQNWMVNHKHRTSGQYGLTEEGGLYDWDGNDMYTDGDYFDDDVGFAYTESGGGHSHGGNKRRLEPGPKPWSPERKNGGRVRPRRMKRGGRTRPVPKNRRMKRGGRVRRR